MVTPGTVTPQPNAHLVGGIVFPWTDRLGNTIATVKGHFNITATQGETVNDVTVTINGLPTTVTQTPGQPTDGTYSLNSGTLAVGTTPTTFAVTVAFTWNGSQLRGSPLTMNWYVYQVVKTTVWNPTYKNDTTDDLVYTTNNLKFVANELGQGTDSLDTNTAAIGQAGIDTRQIYTGFKVLGPPGVTDRPTMTVGVIQTLSQNSVLGVVEYTQDQNPSVTGSMANVVVTGDPGLPWYDSLNNNNPYYSGISSVALSTITPTNNNNTLTWTFGADVINNTTGLQLWDTPYHPLLNSWQWTDGNTYSWGIINNLQRALNGTTRVAALEDVLVASTEDAPGVYVPVDNFKFWTCTFSGYLSMQNDTWVGGSVSSSGGSNTKPSPNGPAGSMITSNFTVP